METIDTLAAVVRTHARSRPERPALTYGGRTWTYGQLDARSSRVARALLDEGVQPGDRVAILDKNSPEFFELQFGAAKVGAVMVAVNWRLSPREIAFIVDDAGARVLVVSEEFVPAIDGVREQLGSLHRDVIIGDAYE